MEESLNINKEKDRLYIVISNTGDEFPKEAIDLILNRRWKEKKTPSRKGHTTGIGMDNVLNRLRLYYEERNVMNIVSENGITKVILSLPFKPKKEIGIKEDV